MNHLNLTVISSNYPSLEKPYRGTFVEQIVLAMARQNNAVSVIAPQGRRSATMLSQVASMERAVDLPIQVFRPQHWSFSKHLFFGYSTFNWTIRSFTSAVLVASRNLHSVPDCCYGHFMYPSGYAAAKLAAKFDIPVVAAVGESSFSHYEDHLDLAKMKFDILQFSGIISVSNMNRDYCVNKLGYDPEKVIVLPNAVDTTKFYPRDRQEVRNRYNLPLDHPIVVFVGHFDERKGALRVLKAIEGLPHVRAIFLGTGKDIPRSSQVLFAGPVKQTEVPEWLSAADLFVLPTLAEGSCNAILEAMACGLPIVSSALPFNYEILDSSVAHLVDPLDINSIKNAIDMLLKDENKRLDMGKNAVERMGHNDIRKRSCRIIKWISESVIPNSKVRKQRAI